MKKNEVLRKRLLEELYRKVMKKGQYISDIELTEAELIWFNYHGIYSYEFNCIVSCGSCSYDPNLFRETNEKYYLYSFTPAKEVNFKND